MKNKFRNFFIILLLVACNRDIEKKFDREKELIQFLKSSENYNLPCEKTIVFILHNQSCGSCVEEEIDFIIRRFKDDPIKKVIILGLNAGKIIDQFKQMTNCDLVIDHRKMLSKYGLDYAADFIIELDKENRSTYWEYLNLQNLDALKKRYSMPK
jgi:hypothetical protein